MNIVVVNDYAAINGGAAKVAIDSAIGLAEQGFHVVYFAATGPIEPMLIESGVKVICLQQEDILNDPKRLRAATQGIWNKLAAKQMTDLLRQYSPDNTIIHVHGWTKALTSSPIRVAMQHGFKIVLTLHDYFIACPNGGFFDYPANKICTKRPLSISCVVHNCDVRSYTQKIWRVIRQLVQKYIGHIPSGVSAFIAVSAFSLEKLQEYLPSKSKIKLIPNPVITSQSKPVEVASNQDFLYIGRLSKEKGTGLFAEAMKQNNLKGIIVGDGPLSSSLRQQYPNMIFTGWLPPNEINKVLQKTRTLVFPSLLYETQGLVVHEAMALGVPVIVSDTSAAQDAIIDGSTGLYFRSGDLSSLKEKILQCQENSSLVSRLGLNAYKTFWSKPPIIDNYINDLVTTYKDVLNEN